MTYDEMEVYFKNITDERAREQDAVKTKKAKGARNAIRRNAKQIEREIESTYDEVVELYKEHDKELSMHPLNSAAIKRSFGSRAGGIINRRNKMKVKLEVLNDSIRNHAYGDNV